MYLVASIYVTRLEIITWPLFVSNLILAVTLYSVLLGGGGDFHKTRDGRFFFFFFFARVGRDFFGSPDFWPSVAYCRTRYNILGEFDRNAENREHM